MMRKTRCFSMNRRRNDPDRGHQHGRAAGLVLGQRHPRGTRQELGKPVKKGPAEAGPLVACKWKECLPSLGVVPVINVLSDLILRMAIALLDFTLKLISLAINRCEVVVSEVSPLLLNLALYLLPVALDAIPIHA
jgi:hypothetical protein